MNKNKMNKIKNKVNKSNFSSPLGARGSLPPLGARGY